MGNKIGIGYEVRLRIESTSGSTGGSEEGADGLVSNLLWSLEELPYYWHSLFSILIPKRCALKKSEIILLIFYGVKRKMSGI